MSELVDKCECCGRPGTPIGDDAHILCVLHEHVIDAAGWLRARSAMRCAFETEEEFMAYVRRNYCAGLEMMKGLQRDPDESDPETMH